MRVETADGRPYFQNVALVLTQWEPPKQTEIAPTVPILPPPKTPSLSSSAVSLNKTYVRYTFSSYRLDGCVSRLLMAGPTFKMLR